MHSQPGEGTSLDDCKKVSMLYLNGLESLVFVMQIIRLPNYLTRQMPGFLGLYNNQNTVFHLLADNMYSCSMELRHRGRSFRLPRCKYNLYKNSFISRCLFKYVYF